jgi:membrane associated rhomboid family serine protease
MIPVCDVIRSRTTPWVTVALLVVNGLVYAYTSTRSDVATYTIIHQFALVPADVRWTTATTSMFIHENAMHATLNGLALWIFGDNVEDQLGHVRYLAFYVFAGYAAALAEVCADPAATAPLIGASGAIAGVVGAYFAMFARSRVLVLMPTMTRLDAVEIPALFFGGLWLTLQIAGGLGRLDIPVVGPPPVVVWPHVGGVLVGYFCVRFFRRPERHLVNWWAP